MVVIVAMEWGDGADSGKNCGGADSGGSNSGGVEVVAVVMRVEVAVRVPIY